MKRIITILILVLCVLFASCTRSEDLQTDVADKIYVYENDGLGGNFIITLYGDGDFSYSEGPLCSYIGYGTWTLEEGVVTLTDVGAGDGELVNRFTVVRGALVYLSSGSDNFMYVRVSEGDRFTVMTDFSDADFGE